MQNKTIISFLIILSALFTIMPHQGYSADAKSNISDPNLELRDAVIDNNAVKVKAIFADKNKAALIKINNRVPSTKFCPGIFLIIASGMGNAEIVYILLNHGANPAIKDEVSGRTALMCAVGCAEPNLKIIRELIQRGADVNAKDNDGVTVLMSATGAFAETCMDPNVHPRLFVVKELMKYNVSINEKDKSGKTALDYAISASRGDVISYLRARNAKASAKK
jgi:hypothetical protein